MAERFDVIVVGAGPAGNAAAFTAAKAGLKVLQIERGESPGTKNVQGSILYSDALERIIPGFREDAPLERHLIEQRMWILDDDSYVGSTYRSQAFNRPPFNRYTINRAQFDRWFSGKVREAGALVICETTVTGLRMEGGRVTGVETDRAGGAVPADVVILADGVNSLLAKKAGFHPEVRPRDVALAVKEVLFLPETVIESRFNIGPDEGVAIELAGSITGGMVGTGFLYTNKESLSLGVGCLVSDLRTHGITPNDLIERLKKHPSIRPLIEGGEMKEYSAHLIPEGGYNAIPVLHGDGWMMAGDAGMFVNSVHREGSNLAMTTGRLAAETVVELRREGRGFRAADLARYRAKLEASFVMKDLKKYRNVPDVLEGNPQFFTQYPGLLNRAAHAMLLVDGEDKRSKVRAIRKDFLAKRSPTGLLGDAFKLWRAFK